MDTCFEIVVNQGHIGLSNLLFLASIGLDCRGTERNSLPKGVRYPGVAAVSRLKVVPVELFFLLSICTHTNTHHSAAYNERAHKSFSKTDSSHLLAFKEQEQPFLFTLLLDLLTLPPRTTTTSTQVTKPISSSGPTSKPSSASSQI